MDTSKPTWAIENIGVKELRSLTGNYGIFNSYQELQTATSALNIPAGSTAKVVDSNGNVTSYDFQSVGGTATPCVIASPTKLDRYLRIATFGDSTSDCSGGGTTNIERQSFAMPTGSQSYAIDHSKATLLDQCRCIAVGSGGIGGQTTQQFLDRAKNAYSTTRKALQDVLATIPDIILMHGASINDFSGMNASTPLATIDAVIDRHRQCVEYFTSAGIHVIDSGCYGFSVAGPKLSAICSIIVYANSRFAALASKNPFWHFSDPSGITHDGTGLYKAGVSGDGTHLNNYGGYLIGIAEKAIVDKLYISGASGAIVLDAQSWFANASGGVPANISAGYNAGKTTINSFTTDASLFTVDATMNASDSITLYINSLASTLFSGLSAGDILAWEYDISVYDYYTGALIPCGEGTRFTLKDSGNTNTLMYEAVSSVCVGPKVLQFALPVSGASIGSSSQLWMGCASPGAGRYLYKFRTPRLRKLTPLT